MRAEEFVTAYRRDATERARYPAEVEDLLAESREWSHQWGVLLHDALAKGSVPPPEWLERFSLAYCDWVNVGQRESAMRFLRWVQESEDEDVLARVAMELNFHRMNGFAQQSWSFLFHQPVTRGQSPNAVDRTCYSLATAALGLDKARELMLDADLFFDPEARLLRAWHTGTLTEIDAFIALLDLTRQQANLVVLPAPAQFEHLAGPANADFIVIDKLTRRVRGIQVKAQVAGAAVGHYDSDRITLIDGARDLQNTRGLRTDPRRSDVRAVAWPGLIAAHFVRELEWSKLTDMWVPRRELIQRKLAARHYTGNIASRTRAAYAAVGDRVRCDLAAPSGAELRAGTHVPLG